MSAESLRLHRDATPPTPEAPADAPLLLRAREAAALCGVSVATWERWHAARRCPEPVRVGVTVRWRRADLVRWAELGCPERRDYEARR